MSSSHRCWAIFNCLDWENTVVGWSTLAMTGRWCPQLCTGRERGQHCAATQMIVPAVPRKYLVSTHQLSNPSDKKIFSWRTWEQCTKPEKSKEKKRKEEKTTILSLLIFIDFCRIFTRAPHHHCFCIQCTQCYHIGLLHSLVKLTIFMTVCQKCYIPDLADGPIIQYTTLHCTGTGHLLTG